MSSSMKTPGVYIQELDAFGNAIVPVATAVPAFIGYTKGTTFNGKSLVNKPIRISSLTEYMSLYDDPDVAITFSVTDNRETASASEAPAIKDYTISNTCAMFRMHSAIQFFYANGGAACYILSVGDYKSTPDPKVFESALKVLEKETEPTIVVIPDAVALLDEEKTGLKEKYADAYSLQSAMISHCAKMMNRVALLDVPGAFEEPEIGKKSYEAFRDQVSGILPNENSFAAAYYPWLHTTIYSIAAVSYKNIDPSAYKTIQTILTAEFTPADPGKVIDAEIKKAIAAFNTTADDASLMTIEQADAIFKNLSASYKNIIELIKDALNLMPPSAAMAGIYTAVDNSTGVWKAPANVAVQQVIATAIKIDEEIQEDLNVPLNGKSICAIRAFPGRGNLVWGARTLDGNSNDWRYINVRRTIIYIEQSVKEASKAYGFAANDASTWVNVQSMISNFLTGVWKQGGLVGPKPADAFSVAVGLGTTMTNDDIQQGIMRVMVKVALSHPAEFIEITFQQEMQKA